MNINFMIVLIFILLSSFETINAFRKTHSKLKRRLKHKDISSQPSKLAGNKHPCDVNTLKQAIRQSLEKPFHENKFYAKGLSNLDDPPKFIGPARDIDFFLSDSDENHLVNEMDIRNRRADTDSTVNEVSLKTKTTNHKHLNNRRYEEDYYYYTD